MRQQGMNIVAIGYGPDANMQQLLQISPCAQFASNPDALGKLKAWIYHRFCL
jgi:hypothetical protein